MPCIIAIRVTLPANDKWKLPCVTLIGSAWTVAASSIFPCREIGSSSEAKSKQEPLMETLNFEYEAKGPLTRRAHVGVVGSGDLEVLIEPSSKPTAQVRVRTSVDGYAQVWKAVLDRFFARFEGAAKVEINDFGATPGTVTLRLEQAAEEVQS
jgi:malonate decarboxylase delta subunit